MLFEETPSTRDARWTAFVRGATRDAGVWLSIVLALSAYRVLLCLSFVRGVDAAEIGRAVLFGLRFDSVIATLVVTPSLVLGLAAYLTGISWLAARVRSLVASAFFVVAPFFYAVDYGFFGEFSDHLNLRLMIALEGSTQGLAETIWKSHHPLRLLFFAAAVAALGLWIVRRIVAARWIPARVARVRGGAARAALIAGVVAVYVVLVRGVSIDESPVRVRNAFVTSDTVLNRTIPSPVATLLHAFEDRQQARRAPSADEVGAAIATIRAARGQPADASVPEILDNILVHARGADRKPRHVFLILMEGQHGFALLPQYRDTGLAPELAKLADRGAFVPAFVSAGSSTDTSLAAIVSGLLVPDLVLSHEERAFTPFATSLAPHFRRLGYRTRFFFGGYLGWARLDLFLSGQGFDEVYGAPSIDGAEGNAWGVWDKGLYDLVLRRVSDDAPSLNVILTTTNHSPYDLPARLWPQLGSAARALAGDDAATVSVFGHEAYADRELGRFVEAAGAKLRQSLFAVTGDHTAHAAHPRFGDNSTAAQVMVPMIFAGDALPANLRGVVKRAASHLDIAPTLYELCAPPGFAYRSFGTSVFDARSNSVGLGSPWIVGAGALVNDDGVTAHALGSGRAVVQSEEIQQLLRQQQAVRTLSRAVVHGGR